MAKRILVIDDEELVTRSLLRLLKAEGYDASVVKSGQEALLEIQDSDFDLIICDVRMPGMDGIETIKQIRAYLDKSNRKNPPEVIITGYADVDKYVNAKELEVFDCLYKPFENQEFLLIIKKALR